MKHIIYLVSTLLTHSSLVFSQSLEGDFSRKKMSKDLEVFKNIRLEANSGLYKYRTHKEIDSIYNWAEKEIQKSGTYRDFYNLICHLTDFEGSLHNDTGLSSKVNKAMRVEQKGYFPYPLKLIEDKLLLNFKSKEIPLSSEIISIDNQKVKEIIPNLYKYYTTDGVNVSGKSIGLNYSFSKYYRLHYGAKDSFNITFKTKDSNDLQSIVIKSISYSAYYENVKSRHSYQYDYLQYEDANDNQSYTYQNIDHTTGLFTINTFDIGDHANTPKHLKYVQFLDSIFAKIKEGKIQNLIVDVRNNGGGNDPNDLVTYSYLAQRNFVENKQAWIKFNKIPYLRFIDNPFPVFLRPLGVGRFNKHFSKTFPVEKNSGFYQDSTSLDHKVRIPDKNSFTGNIYLLISPRVASAGSLFAAMVAGNKNTTVIGEETMGGYYGHNGHTPFSYILPKSKIEVSFSIVNLEQDVPKKDNQIYNRGIIPDHRVRQSFHDFLNHEDTQLNYTLKLIKVKD